MSAIISNIHLSLNLAADYCCGYATWITALDYTFHELLPNVVGGLAYIIWISACSAIKWLTSAWLTDAKVDIKATLARIVA
jgi:hypothetical protein